MTDEQYRERILAAEKYYYGIVDQLSSVQKRSKPGNGESNVLHDIVASMAAMQRNNKEIDFCHSMVQALTETIENDYYEADAPVLDNDRVRNEVEEWRARWRSDER